MTNLTTLDAVLKTNYIGPLNELVNNDVKLLQRVFQDNEAVVTGKNFTMPLHVGRNEGVGARLEGADLPDAGAQNYVDAIIPMKYLYGRINLTGQTIRAAKNNEGAFVRAVDSEMRGITRDLKADINRQLFGDGTGKLAAATANSSASTTVTVDTTKNLRVGMIIDIIADNGTASVTGARITAVTGTTITHNGTGAAVAANSYIYRHGSRNNELMGLKGIISDVDPYANGLQGIKVADNPIWKASVMANGGTNRALSLTLLRTMLDTIETAGNGKVSALYTTHGVRRAYEALLQAERQFVNVMKFDGGIETLTYDGLPIIADKDCDANRIYFVDEDAMTVLNLGENGFAWMDEDGAILNRVNNKDAYSATLFRYSEFATKARNAHGLLADITEA